MDGMARWKCVEPLARERYASPVSQDGSSIRPLLVKHGLQEMRQRRSDQGSDQDVVGYAPLMAISVPGIEPPSGSERADDMLIGSPCEKFGDPLR
jgi:hypothetical protein